MAHAGDYVIVVGGRAGAVKVGNRWYSFECSICMRRAGLLVRRLGTNDNRIAMTKAYESPKGYRCTARPKHK